MAGVAIRSGADPLFENCKVCVYVGARARARTGAAVRCGASQVRGEEEGWGADLKLCETCPCLSPSL